MKREQKKKQFAFSNRFLTGILEKIKSKKLLLNLNALKFGTSHMHQYNKLSTLLK
jgi:hypothetical protein